jgi:hypothetical protein
MLIKLRRNLYGSSGRGERRELEYQLRHEGHQRRRKMWFNWYTVICFLKRGLQLNDPPAWRHVVPLRSDCQTLASLTLYMLPCEGEVADYGSD